MICFSYSFNTFIYMLTIYVYVYVYVYMSNAVLPYTRNSLPFIKFHPSSCSIKIKTLFAQYITPRHTHTHAYRAEQIHRPVCMETFFFSLLATKLKEKSLQSSNIDNACSLTSPKTSTLCVVHCVHEFPCLVLFCIVECF